MTLQIIQTPSANFNERQHPLDMLVLHYTGMKDGPTALARMLDSKEPRVSAHYMVEEDGRVFQLVDESMRAWQAGRSWWRGDEDLNSRSIGIEIVNGGHDFGLPPFPDVQIEAVIALCQGILGRWAIPPERIVAHSDIAPDRKEDPGERFPWKRLAEAGIGLWPQHARPEPWMKASSTLSWRNAPPSRLSSARWRLTISPRSFCARHPPTAICMPGRASLTGRRWPRLP